MEKILEVNGLTKTFRTRGKGSFTAVDHVSFCVSAGETLGIVGESGCGKSTLARLLCRLVEPTEGSIQLCGTELAGASNREMQRVYRNIQMVFQDPVTSFDPRKTLGDGIGESLRNVGIPTQLVKVVCPPSLPRVIPTRSAVDSVSVPPSHGRWPLSRNL